MGSKGPRYQIMTEQYQEEIGENKKLHCKCQKMALQCGLHDCYKIDTVWARAQNFKIEKPAAANC